MVTRADRVGVPEEVAIGTTDTRLRELWQVLACIILVEIVNVFVPRMITKAISWIISWF